MPNFKCKMVQYIILDFLAVQNHEYISGENFLAFWPIYITKKQQQNCFNEFAMSVWPLKLL